MSFPNKLMQVQKRNNGKILMEIGWNESSNSQTWEWNDVANYGSHQHETWEGKIAPANYAEEFTWVHRQQRNKTPMQLS